MFGMAAADEAARAGQLAMLQHIDSISNQSWSSTQLSGLLVKAVYSGSVEVCEWLRTYFNAGPTAQDWQRHIRCTLPLNGAQWAVQHGFLTWDQLVQRYGPARRYLNPSTRRALISCEALHWVQENAPSSDCSASSRHEN